MNNFISRVVIRHLPPTMSEEQFVDQVAPLPDYNYFHFEKADYSLGQFAFCRCVINFVRKDDIFVFKDKFDGYVFLDAKGNEYPASVEFSMYQKTAHRRAGNSKRKDPKCGTICDDPDFKNFMESLSNKDGCKNLPSAEVYLEEIEARCKDAKANKGKVTTPLIEYLLQKKAEKIKMKEERREERRKERERKILMSQENNAHPVVKARTSAAEKNRRDRERDVERERTREREREKTREKEKIKIKVREFVPRERDRQRKRDQEKAKERDREQKEKAKEARFKDSSTIKVKQKEVPAKSRESDKDRESRPEPKTSKPQGSGSFRFIRKQLSEAQLLE